MAVDNEERPLVFKHANVEESPTVCVIAEIGVNHDGDVGKAKELVSAAALAGADAVKVQMFTPHLLLSKDARLAPYQFQCASSAMDMLNSLSLSVEDLVELKSLAHAHNISFVVTPFTIHDAGLLDTVQPDAIKIASSDCVNTPLLERVAEIEKPKLISTGASEWGELRHLPQLLTTPRGCVLQCASSYPAHFANAALGGIEIFRRYWSIPVGYSDHTTEMVTGAMAVAAGACLIEKHITYDTAAAGPDHAASMNPKQFMEYVGLVRKAELMVGVEDKQLQSCEFDVRTWSRQSVCTKSELQQGITIQESDVTVKRPGTGIPAKEIGSVIGKRMTRTVGGDYILMPSDLVD